MKNTFYILLATLLLCAAAYANPVEITIYPSDATVRAGSGTELKITIKNNLDANQTIKVFAAGPVASYVTFSPDALTVPAKGESTVYLRIDATMSTPAITSNLKISASSLDGLYWDSKDVTVTVAKVVGGMQGIDQVATLSTVKGSRFHLSLYLNPQLYNSAGYNLKNGDDCCVGDTFVLKTQPKGDDHGDGGPVDSPPVIFVDNLAATIQDIDSSLFHPQTDKIPLCTYLARCDFCCPYCRGRADCQCTCPARNLGQADCSCVKDMAVICESKCRDELSGTAFGENGSFIATGEGQAVISAACDASCIIYDATPGAAMKYEYITLANPEDEWYNPSKGLRIAEIKETFNLNAIKDERKPVIEVKSYSYTETNGKTTIKVDIANHGDAMAYIDAVKLSIPQYRVLYNPQTVNPGAESSILFETDSPNAPGVKADIGYTSEKTGCLKTKKFSASFNVGTCNTNIDCNDGRTETEDFCNNPGKIDSYCTNIKSDIISAVSTTQTYRMDVSGDCSNIYYGCYTPNRDKKFIAGEQCYNTIDKYRTDVAARFSLKFDLSTLKKGLKISTVRLYLTAGDISFPQDITAYSAENNWEGANCIPGGDICTQPYCPECSQTHESNGTALSTAHAGIQGKIFFDVTKYVKDKYEAGEQYATLQIRGTESKSTCGGAGQWTRSDVEFDAAASVPYLKILEAG